jgi:hypothetical protein
LRLLAGGKAGSRAETVPYHQPYHSIAAALRDPSTQTKECGSIIPS